MQYIGDMTEHVDAYMYVPMDSVLNGFRLWLDDHAVKSNHLKTTHEVNSKMKLIILYNICENINISQYSGIDNIECRVNRSLLSTRKDLNYLHHHSVLDWICLMTTHVLQDILAAHHYSVDKW